MILRILNPPHAGAQAEIGTEPLTIGSGADCDLILSDPLLQPAHCKIRLAGEGIEVELTGGAAHLDGEPVEKSPFTVRAGQVLSIGSTHIAFGKAGEVWPEVSIPTLKTLGGSAPVAAEASAVADLKKTVPPDPSVEAKALLARRLKFGSLGIVGMLVILVVAMFFHRAEQQRAMTSMARTPGGPSVFGTDFYKTNNDNLASEKVAEKIRQEISGSTASIYERSGRAVLRVYVRTRGQANEAQKIVNSSPVPVFSEIISLEEVENSAQMMAAMKGFNLDVTFAKDGSAYWNGYLPEENDWRVVREKLEIDLPYIKENINNITFAPQIEKRARELLAKANVKGNLVFTPGPKEIAISGSIPENQAEEWIQVLKALKEEFGTMLSFVDNISTGKAVVVSNNPFHTQIVGVSLGAIPAVILLDGQRIYEGSILGDGSTLTKITESNLVLTGAAGVRSLPLSAEALTGSPGNSKLPLEEKENSH